MTKWDCLLSEIGGITTWRGFVFELGIWIVLGISSARDIDNLRWLLLTQDDLKWLKTTLDDLND